MASNTEQPEKSQPVNFVISVFLSCPVSLENASTKCMTNSVWWIHFIISFRSDFHVIMVMFVSVNLCYSTYIAFLLSIWVTPPVSDLARAVLQRCSFTPKQPLCEGVELLFCTYFLLGWVWKGGRKSPWHLRVVRKYSLSRCRPSYSVAMSSV